MPNLQPPQRTANAARRAPVGILDSTFANPDLAPAEPRIDPLPHDDANEQISDLLTLPQKRRLLEILGEPLAARPRGSPPALLRLGTKEFAFPRVEGDDGWERTFQIGRREILGSVAILTLLKEYAVREELKLEIGPVERLPPFTGHAGDFTVIRNELRRALLPAQLDRLRELSLQLFSRNCGTLALLEFGEVADALALNDEQRVRLAGLLQSESRSTRRSLIAAIERNSDRRREFDTATDRRLDDLLSAAQRRKLAEFLGKPFRRKLPSVAVDRSIVSRSSLRGRVAPTLGYLTSIPPRFQSAWLMERTLILSPQQAAVIRESYDSGPTQDVDGLIQHLNPEQLRQYIELVLQGSSSTDGPASVFRFRVVIDALALSEEQNRRMLEVLWDDTRRYMNVPLAELAENLPELDEQTSKAIATILTVEQRRSLRKCLGQPADDRFSNNQLGSRIKNPETVAKAARSDRRALYQARHRSPRDLTNTIRRHFLPGDRVRAVASPEGNGVLLAAPVESFERVVAAISELDRPKRLVIVDIVIAEAPSDRQREPLRETANPTVEGAPFGAALLDETELAGPIEQVTARLNILAKEKKITTWRTFRLEAVEDEAAITKVEDAALIVRGVSKFASGFSTPQFWPQQLQSRIHVTPSLAADGMIKLDLTLRHTRMETPDDTDELGISPDGPLIAHHVINDRLDATLELKSGTHVITSRIQTDAKSASQVYVIVGAQIKQSQ
jgi:hypothetical protein